MTKQEFIDDYWFPEGLSIEDALEDFDPAIDYSVEALNSAVKHYLHCML